MAKKQSRGVRNNNPLNIRKGNDWFGEMAKNTDGEFEQFTDMLFGLRAAFILLRRYINGYGLTTVEKIISRWAPSSENKTEKYIRRVCNIMWIPRNVHISFEDKFVMIKLVYAMAIVESGIEIPFEKIELAYSMVVN